MSIIDNQICECTHHKNNKKMTLNEYQDLASLTAKFPQGSTEGLTYTALGLNGEAGEVAEHVKKCIRDDKGFLTPKRANAIIKEIGDCLWYASMLARVIGVSLEDVAVINIKKLQDRAKRGKIHGEGDDR